MKSSIGGVEGYLVPRLIRHLLVSQLVYVEHDARAGVERYLFQKVDYGTSRYKPAEAA